MEGTDENFGGIKESVNRLNNENTDLLMEGEWGKFVVDL